MLAGGFVGGKVGLFTTAGDDLLLQRLNRLWGFDVSTSLTIFASTCRTGALRVEGMAAPQDCFVWLAPTLGATFEMEDYPW